MILTSAQHVLVKQAFAQYFGPQAPATPPPKENIFSKALDKIKEMQHKQDGTAEGHSETAAQPKVKKQQNSAAPPFLPFSKTPVVPDRPPLISQPPLQNAKIETPEIDTQNPPKLDAPKLDDPNNPLGFTDALLKLNKYSKLIDAKSYQAAKPGLTQLRTHLIQLTEAHIALYKALKKISSAKNQALLEKELALQFAKLRDQSMVQMAKIHLSEKQHLKAVKELTEVIQSQPKSQLGIYAYGMLQEAGFTEKLQLAQ
ncbi:MAG: hypothetical protein AAGI66_07185 [Cyanobacteria bacterium P01_H01_bin.74]